jgi:hypothetical protein
MISPQNAITRTSLGKGGGEDGIGQPVNPRRKSMDAANRRPVPAPMAIQSKRLLLGGFWKGIVLWTDVVFRLNVGSGRSSSGAGDESCCATPDDMA